MDCVNYRIMVISEYIILSGLILFTNCASSFYIPGVAPREYEEHEIVEIKAVKMTSSKTQLPYEYYSLPVCKPHKIEYKTENLGEVLRGDRIVNTLYDVAMNTNKTCLFLCELKLTQADVKLLAQRIKEDYYVHFLADNLPAATAWIIDEDTNEIQMERGFKLGIVSSDGAYINNHLSFTMKYSKWSTDTSTYRVVGFEVKPRSIDKLSLKHDDTSLGSKCTVNFETAKRQMVDEHTKEILFTYDVTWVPSNIRWASRWDNYLKMGDVQVHWFSIVNSIVVVFFLAGVLTMIIIRTLRRDIAQYNQENDDIEDALEETGWKLVHGDVFRPPKRIMLLVSFIGAGVQLFGMSLVTIVAAMLGMLSPASRGALLTASFLLYIFMGVFGGFYAGRLYKTLKGQLWKRAAVQTALLYPSLCLFIAFLLNFFIWGKHSSGAVPFTTMIALLAMWFCVSLPLVVVGFYFGYRKQAYKNPVRTNQIPRQVPSQLWYAHPLVSILLAGILPFGAVFIELFFIFSAIWENQFYYLFGFLFIVFVILVIACSQIAIVMVYFQLCAEDYHWWWKSFLVSGGSAVYVFLYSLFYFNTQLEITAFIPTLLYFGYTFIIVFTFWILTGTIGFWASFIFIRKIYAQVKVD